MVAKELAAQHCFGAVGTREGRDDVRYNVTCVAYGLRPTAILHYASPEQLKWVKQLDLSVLPILEVNPEESVDFVVYDASRPESVLKAKLLSILGPSDTRAYSPSKKLFFSYGVDENTWRPCVRIGGGLQCSEDKKVLQSAKPLLHAPFMVGTILGYQPQAVKVFSFQNCRKVRKKSVAECLKEYQREKEQFETLLSPISDQYQGFVDALKTYI